MLVHVHFSSLKLRDSSYSNIQERISACSAYGEVMRFSLKVSKMQTSNFALKHHEHKYYNVP